MSQIAWFWSCQFLLCILPSKIINNLSKTRNRKSNQAFLPQEQERVYVFGGLHAGCWKGKKPVYRGRALFRVFFFFSHLLLLGKPPAPALGAADSPRPVLTAHTVPRATAQEQRKYRLQQLDMKYQKSPLPVSPGHGWWQLAVSSPQRL